jgi:hypothetical protein
MQVSTPYPRKEKKEKKMQYSSDNTRTWTMRADEIRMMCDLVGLPGRSASEQAMVQDRRRISHHYHEELLIVSEERRKKKHLHLRCLLDHLAGFLSPGSALPASDFRRLDDLLALNAWARDGDDLFLRPDRHREIRGRCYESPDDREGPDEHDRDE